MNKHPLQKQTPLKRLKPATLIVVCFVYLAGCGGEPSSDETASKAAPPARGTIVAMGDSLTAGHGLDENEAYPAQLQKKLDAEGYHYKVVNAGVSGETSSGALSRIDWVISSLKPDLIILETGANDGLRGIDPDVLRKNLDRIVSVIRERDIAVILCGMKMPANLGPVFIREFSDIYPEIARKHAIPLVPFFLEGVAGNPQYNQPDRMHPSAEGYRRIVDHIYPHVLSAIEKLPENSQP